METMDSLGIVCSFEVLNYLISLNIKPLESILKKPLSSAPCRLQEMMMRRQKYDVDVHYQPGAKMYIADLPSRAYLPEVGFEDDKEFELVNMVKPLPINHKKLEEIRQETEADEALQVLKSLTLKGGAI